MYFCEIQHEGREINDIGKEAALCSICRMSYLHTLYKLIKSRFWKMYLFLSIIQWLILKCNHDSRLYLKMNVCYEENLAHNEKYSIVITLKYFNVEYIGVLYDDLSNTYSEFTNLVK